MSTLDKDVYERLYKRIEQVVLDSYLNSNELRWRSLYSYLKEESLARYESVLLYDLQVSVEVNRRDCEHIKVLITINTIL